MTDQEFIDFTMFKPYEKLSTGPDSWDCWGLVVGYFKYVHNIELKMYDHGEIEEGFFREIETGKWEEDGAGVVFMAFNGGHPAHCGLLFGNKVLHASGEGGIGQVTLHPLRLIKRRFEDVKIYAYCKA
jgi:cell wall-associated NlpC family hydrolase